LATISLNNTAQILGRNRTFEARIVRIQRMDWNSAQALDALRGSELLDLGMSANQVRRNLHPEPVVTYELCGPAASLDDLAGEAVLHVGKTVNLAQVRDIEHNTLDALKALLVAQRKRLPEVTFHHLPVSWMKGPESILAFTEALPDLQSTGLRSISLDFDPAFSLVSYGEVPRLLRAAAACSLLVSASITIGNAESLEQRIGILQMLRDLQQDSHSIQAARIRVHHAASPEARREEEATAVDYLRTLAVTRIFLDNVEHLQTDWSVMGPKVLELALRFGADDAGAVPWSQAGNPEPSHHGGESELRRIIRDAGFRPVERDALFRQSLLH
jgi:cyclic dehypoxanthinyl futalosine synthase